MEDHFYGGNIIVIQFAVYDHSKTIAKLINGLITYLRSQTEGYTKTTKINEQVQQYL